MIRESSHLWQNLASLAYWICLVNRKWVHSNQIIKISSEKILKRWSKANFILLEKSVLEFFFPSFIDLHISGIYLQINVTFRKLPYKFHISHFYPIFGLVYYKSIPEWKDTVLAFLLQEWINLLVGNICCSHQVFVLLTHMVYGEFIRGLFSKWVCSKLSSF